MQNPPIFLLAPPVKLAKRPDLDGAGERALDSMPGLKVCFSPALDRDRNAFERMFGRIKGFRRIATRYDKLARNFLVAMQIVATACYGL